MTKLSVQTNKQTTKSLERKESLIGGRVISTILEKQKRVTICSLAEAVIIRHISTDSGTVFPFPKTSFIPCSLRT